MPQYQHGGVVQPATLYSIQVQEIVRATTLAIRRRTELLGPTCRHDPLTSELVTVLSRRPGAPNHWSEAWIDVQLGLALELGLPVIKHSDGDIRPVLDMILDAGIDCLDPIDPMGGLDMGEFKRKYGHRVALKGNVNCAQTLTFGTERQVVEETLAVIRAAGEGGGLIVSSSNSIHSSVKPGNYLAMWNTIRAYGKYPLRLDAWSDSGAIEAFS
jgi:hypothetical protein